MQLTTEEPAGSRPWGMWVYVLVETLEVTPHFYCATFSTRQGISYGGMGVYGRRVRCFTKGVKDFTRDWSTSRHCKGINVIVLVAPDDLVGTSTYLFHTGCLASHLQILSATRSELHGHCAILQGVLIGRSTFISMLPTCT